MIDIIRELINVILEQQETIAVLVEATRTGHQLDDDVYQEIAEHNRRVRKKMFRLKKQIESTI